MVDTGLAALEREACHPGRSLSFKFCRPGKPVAWSLLPGDGASPCRLLRRPMQPSALPSRDQAAQYDPLVPSGQHTGHRAIVRILLKEAGEADGLRCGQGTRGGRGWRSRPFDQQVARHGGERPEASRRRGVLGRQEEAARIAVSVLRAVILARRPDDVERRPARCDRRLSARAAVEGRVSTHFPDEPATPMAASAALGQTGAPPRSKRRPAVSFNATRAAAPVPCMRATRGCAGRRER